MGEAVGLGFSLVSLAGLFNTAVDNYQYIRLGRNYARDFETNQTKLDLSRLQLSRWGVALGLDAPAIEIESLLSLSISSPHEVEQAEKALGNIVHLLDDARTLSNNYVARNKPEAADVLNPDSLTLHQKITKLVDQRQRNTSFSKKKTWALYGKNDLDRLVTDIIDLTDQLVRLFPATTVWQQQLSEMEVKEMDDNSLFIVKEVADNQDTILADAVNEAIRAHGHIYESPHTRDGAAEHNGDLIYQGYNGQVGGLSHTYVRALAEGTGTHQHNGNVYGGTSTY